MNDFTKEELEQIMHGLYHANISDWPIAKKIQSLIDNYCEHEWGEDPNDGHGWMCSECGVKQ